MLYLSPTPELEQRLQEEAEKRGLPTSEYALRLLASSLAQAADANEQDIFLDSLLGAFTHVPFSSEDLHRERREDEEGAERNFSQRFPQTKE